MKDDGWGRVGPKQPINASRAVCASQHPIVTDAMLDIVQNGGTAYDAVIAGSLLHATIQHEMTNHAGTVTLLCWDADSGGTHELDSMGTIVPDVAPFRPVPAGLGDYATPPGTIALIPGFMPGLKAIYERFSTLSWEQLCRPAIYWAEQGHEVGSFEHLVHAKSVDIYLYTASGRAHFTPEGHLPQVGDRWPKPELAATLARLAREGPDDFITGEWARLFVTRANELGWPIEISHMSAIPPRWGEGTRYRHRGYEIVQLSPPNRQAVISALILGVLEELDVPTLGHYTESAESLYYMAHVLRRALFETGYVNDPLVFGDPTPALMSRDFHRGIAALLRSSKPKIDLTRHVELAFSAQSLRAAGAEFARSIGSCELSVVDHHGNWVQMMNTLQGGGIPGEVVGGVPMIGAATTSTLSAMLGGWFTGGGRLRSPIGNTLVFKNGQPWLALGTPGLPHITLPQVLSSILDHGFDPYAADDAPRMMPLEDDYSVTVESRIAADIVAAVAKLGVLIKPAPSYYYPMGSFQISWRDDDGTLHASAGPRRAGKAAGY